MDPAAISKFSNKVLGSTTKILSRIESPGVSTFHGIIIAISNSPKNANLHKAIKALYNDEELQMVRVKMCVADI